MVVVLGDSNVGNLSAPSEASMETYATITEIASEVTAGQGSLASVECCVLVKAIRLSVKNGRYPERSSALQHGGSGIRWVGRAICS